MLVYYKYIERIVRRIECIFDETISSVSEHISVYYDLENHTVFLLLIWVPHLPEREECAYWCILATNAGQRHFLIVA